MIINGLALPTLLCRLVAAQAWKRPHDDTVFRALVNVEAPEDFTFLDFEGMARETDAARMIAADLATARLYGLKPLAYAAASHSDDQFLDIAKAVMIAVNWDEDAIFLDYRASSEPSVVLSTWSDTAANATCLEIAPDFEEFARRAGLPSP